jgi:outer membrane receptor for ferric coprogen and ferric-rhodotorulic acid
MATTAPASTTSSNAAPATPAPSGRTNPATSSGNATAKTTSQTTTQLQTVVVEGVPINANALPTRPTDAVYGLGDTVQNTPRSIYQVSQDQLINDPVQSVSDLAKYSPSISNITSQGIAGAPYIRGYTAEVYEDGIRVEHPNTPFDTNAYQSVDIVTGPASVVYGPSANTSGYLDWEAKQPEFDGNHTTINTTFGNWDSGGTGSYANFSQQIDNTGPINKDLAYRVSYKQNEADSYYTGVATTTKTSTPL